tara:strand:+ start:196 stop:2733 length:2538 start_codon:yes stop_codon:yes gene_type:complete
MKTPQEYLNKKLPIIPCDGKIPIVKSWQDRDFNEEDFKPGNNIGLKMAKHFDIDIDNQLCKKFLSYYMETPSAIYGRKSNPGSHWLYKGAAEYKKFALPKAFDYHCKDFPHGSTLIEIRAGKQRQSIVPGSIVNDEVVEWERFEGISPYSNNPNDDISKVALSTALHILFPNKGNRDTYMMTIACLLCRTKWTAEDINYFCKNLAAEQNIKDSKTNNRDYGTMAKDKQKKKARMFGFTKLKEVTGISFKGLMTIFSWVGIEPPDEKLLDLCEKYYYLQDTGLMYDPKTSKEYTETIFNNNHLFDFPGGKNKDKAFKGLLKETEFQERIMLSKQFLPDYEFPIAKVTSHKLLPPGRYYNLWNGFDVEAIWNDEKEIEFENGSKTYNVKEEIDYMCSHYEKILGKKNWENISQYIAMCLKHPGQKHRWVPLIISPEGVGKGLLLRMISNMMGPRYVNENVSFADITEKHSTIVVGHLFVALNEVSVDGGQYTTKRTISAKIKPFISDDFLNINEKGKPIYKYLNNCNAMIFSNDENCLHIDTSSRRYYVCNVKVSTNEIEQMAKNDEFKRLWFIAENFAEELMYYFTREVEIADESVYSKRAPKTLDLLEMIEDSKHDLLQELDDALENKTPPFDDMYFRGFISLNQLIYFVRTQWKIKHVPRKLIKNWLKENSIPWSDGKLTRQIMMREQRPRVHLLDDKDHRANLKDLTEGELGELADQHYPGSYKEHEALDYRMKNYEGGVGKREMPPEETQYRLQRAFPHLMNLEYGHLDQLVEIKRHADVEKRIYDKKNYEGKSPAEVHQIINVKYKNKLIKEFKKLLKKYDPNKELAQQIVKNAHEDDRNY